MNDPWVGRYHCCGYEADENHLHVGKRKGKYALTGKLCLRFPLSEKPNSANSLTTLSTEWWDRVLSYAGTYRSRFAMELDDLRDGGIPSRLSSSRKLLVDGRRDMACRTSEVDSSVGTNEPGPPYCFGFALTFFTGGGSCVYNDHESVRCLQC